MNDTKLSEELIWRGLIKDKTFSDTTWLDIPRTFYLGTDCSSDSLQVGNLAIYLFAKRLINFGWKPVMLVGGATSLIGDPGGKEEERKLPDRDVIKNNVLAIEDQIKNLFAGKEFLMVDNYDWFKDIYYLEFLRDVGKYYSMTELIQRDYIAERIGKDGAGISYAEFSYSLIQGYDYWYLNKNYNVELQIGGSDQWGNMLSGVPLIRKKEGKEVHSMSMPLVINKSTGKKFGKSETGTIWLDSRKTSVNDFYQFWINVDDNSTYDYLKIYTELSKEEIIKIIEEHTNDPSNRIGQRKLADEVTRIVHGQAALEEAQKHAAALVSGSDLPTLKIKVHDNIPTSDVLVETKLVQSKSEARRLIESGGIYKNGDTFKKEIIEKEDFIDGKLILRRGKALKDSVQIELAE